MLRGKINNRRDKIQIQFFLELRRLFFFLFFFYTTISSDVFLFSVEMVMVLQLCKLCNNEGRQLKSISSRNGDRETCRRGRRDRTRGKEYLSEQRLRFEAYLQGK